MQCKQLSKDSPGAQVSKKLMWMYEWIKLTHISSSSVFILETELCHFWIYGLAQYASWKCLETFSLQHLDKTEHINYHWQNNEYTSIETTAVCGDGLEIKIK